MNKIELNVKRDYKATYK